MMNERLNSDLAKELIVVLSYSDGTFLNNIPDHVLKNLNDLAAESKNDYYIDKNKSLSSQNISEECKDLLALMYVTYMLDATSRNEMLDIWFKNDSEHKNGN